MDKQFINIDELIRQRLDGGEEEERAGAWTNMRNLLDQEMPQKKRRGGFFFWFNGMAILMLISAISFGGYELTSFIERSSAKTLASSAYTLDNNLVASSAPDNINLSSHMRSKEASSPHGFSSSSVSRPNDKTSTATDQQIKNNANAIAANTETTKNKRNKIATANEQINTTIENGSSEQVARQAIALNKVTSTGNTKADATGNTANEVKNYNSSASTKATGVKKNINTVAASDITASMKANKTTFAATKETVHNTALKSNTATTATKTANNPVRSNATSGNTSGSKLALASSKVVNNTSSNFQSIALHTAATAGNANHSSLHTSANKKNKHTTINSDPCNGVTSVTATVTKAAKPHKYSPAKNKITTNSNATASNVRTKSVQKTVATGNIGIAKSVAVNKLPLAANMPAPKNATLPKAQSPDNNADGQATAVTYTKEKKPVTKLILHEHLVKTATNETYKQFDTISLEKIEVETGLLIASSSSSSNNTAGKAASKSSSNTSTIHSSGRNTLSAAPSDETTAATPEETTTTPVLAAAAEKPAMAVKENKEVIKPAAPKKASEPSTIEKLNETFNDIKYHVKGMQFAPGITAGINSTFFGPSNLKGFQFGVTGEFIFSQSLSVKSELKYFHRINNNFAVQDEYSVYTQVGSTYRKDEYSQSYGFSTLHSLELPVSVRYTSGKFSFFAGGNVVYSFAVNTGLIGPPAITNSSMVTTVGTDNTPKIKEGDFNSRFGAGYLFGMSFQAAPNLIVDIRNVQTVWDNASSSGSKYISGQLFKSPSLQVGVAYRFGGKKENE